MPQQESNEEPDSATGSSALSCVASLSGATSSCAAQSSAISSSAPSSDKKRRRTDVSSVRTKLYDKCKQELKDMGKKLKDAADDGRQMYEKENQDLTSDLAFESYLKNLRVRVKCYDLWAGLPDSGDASARDDAKAAKKKEQHKQKHQSDQKPEENEQKASQEEQKPEQDQEVEQKEQKEQTPPEHEEQKSPECEQKQHIVQPLTTLHQLLAQNPASTPVADVESFLSRAELDAWVSRILAIEDAERFDDLKKQWQELLVFMPWCRSGRSPKLVSMRKRSDSIPRISLLIPRATCQA